MNKNTWILIIIIVLIAVGGIWFYNRSNSAPNIGLSFISPKSGDAWEAGKKYKIEWTGGSSTVDIYLIDKSLESTGASVSISDRLQNLSNTGSYDYQVPSSLSGQYKFTIHSGGISADSPYFEIKKTASSSVEYRDAKYGFAVKLPDNWKGFSTTTKQWSGQVYKNGMDAARDNGPIISISAPTSTGIKQDIPVMVFTHLQWNLIMAGGSSSSTTFMSVSAAPIPPSKLGENSKYVLAIPARYNYAFPQGFEEVDRIIQDKSNWTFFNP